MIIFNLQRFTHFSNHTPKSLVGGTAYDDKMYNYGADATLMGNAGDDKLVSFDDGVGSHLYGGAGNDTIHSWSDCSYIDGGTGRDYLYCGNHNSITASGGLGNDSIIGYGYYSSISGGAGDDELYGNDGKDVFYYKPGDGNDTIFGYESGVDRIILSNGKVKNVATDRNNNVIFTIGDGQLVINKGADRYVEIVNPSGKTVGQYVP